MKISTKQNRAGFTLVEIMIVIAIIGLLAAIAIPNLVKARTTTQKNACIKNLQQIDGAKAQWAIENKKGDAAAVDEAAVNTYIKSGAPECPASGAYTYNALGTPPSCSIAGHALPGSAAADPTGDN